MSDTADSTLGDGDSSYRQTTPTGSSALQQSQPISDTTAAMKVTRGHSCILCQQRKVRCDKSKPCSNCVKAGVECRVVPPQPPRRRKKRVPERDLVDRLRKYEAMLTQHGIEFEGLGPDVKILDPGTVQEGDELDSEFIKVRESPARSDPDLISSPGETPHIPRSAPTLAVLITCVETGCSVLILTPERSSGSPSKKRCVLCAAVNLYVRVSMTT